MADSWKCFFLKIISRQDNCQNKVKERLMDVKMMAKLTFWSWIAKYFLWNYIPELYWQNNFHEVQNFRDTICKSKFCGKFSSRKYILLRYYWFNKWQGLVRSKTENVTWNWNFRHAISTQYAAIMSWNKLIGSNIYWKKHGRQQQSIKTIALFQLFKFSKDKE